MQQPTDGDPFCAKHRAWWETLHVSPMERLHVRHDLATLDQVVGQLGEIDDELAARVAPRHGPT